MDLVVLARAGERLVVYRFDTGGVTFMSGSYEVDRRYVQGFPVDWAVGKTTDLLGRAPLGVFGDLYLDEPGDARFEVRDGGIYLYGDGDLMGRVPPSQEAHWMKKAPAARDAKLKWLAEEGIRVLHDGEGSIYRIVKAKRPKQRKQA